MDTGEERALDEIHRLAELDRIRFTRHARKRMVRRGAGYADVKCALMSAPACHWQPNHQRWLTLGGEDLDGDALDVAVEIEDDLIVVTVMGK